MPAMEADRGFAFGIFQTRGEFYSDVFPKEIVLMQACLDVLQKGAGVGLWCRPGVEKVTCPTRHDVRVRSGPSYLMIYSPRAKGSTVRRARLRTSGLLPLPMVTCGLNRIRRSDPSGHLSPAKDARTFVPDRAFSVVA